MHPRARGVVISGIDTALSAMGYQDAELALARADVVEWARARVQAARGGRRVARGSRIVVTGRGHAELRPFDVALAGPGEITIEVMASAISAGTERAQWLRLPNAQPQIPYSPGYSVAGAVLSAGTDTAFKSGQLVAIPRLPHASVATAPAEWTVPVPDDVAAPEAALVYLAIIAGYGVRRAGLREGGSLCVIGAGPIGALAQRLAAGSAPGHVTVVARTRRGEAAARDAGADEFLTGAPEGVRADTVIEATGDPSAISAAVAAAQEGGTVVLLGSPRGRSPSGVIGDAQRKGLRLVGAHISALATEARRTGEDPFQELAGSFLSALAAGELPVADLVGEALDPREAQLVYRRLARGDLTGGHFDWQHLPSAERASLLRTASRPKLIPARPRLRPQVQEPPAAATERRLRFALIGCGDVGLHNARAIAGAANTELAICHDPVPALAEATAREVGGRVAESLTEALERVDAVCLCVPHDLHTPMVEQAAEAGLHVVVEKPLANDLAAAQRAIAATERAGVAFSVCFPYRYEPAIRMAYDMARAGALGEPRGATVVFHADKPESYWVGGFSGRSHSDWRSSRARAGGGVLIMNLTHYLDFIRFVAGVEAERVWATARWEPDAEVEDSIVIGVRFGGGAIAAISGSSSTRGAPETRCELWGELGTVRLEPDPAIYTERALEGVPTARWCTLPDSPQRDPRALYFEAFAAAVAAGRPADVPSADGLAIQAIVDAAYRSLEEGGSVAVETPQATPMP